MNRHHHRYQRVFWLISFWLMFWLIFVVIFLIVLVFFVLRFASPDLSATFSFTLLSWPFLAFVFLILISFLPSIFLTFHVFPPLFALISIFLLSSTTPFLPPFFSIPLFFFSTLPASTSIVLRLLAFWLTMALWTPFQVGVGAYPDHPCLLSSPLCFSCFELIPEGSLQSR